MNFLELCQYIADQNDHARPMTVYNVNPDLLSRRVRRWRGHVNKAYTLLKQALGFKNEYEETETTLTLTGGTESYDIPTGILTVQELRADTDPPIRILPWTEYNRYKSDSLVITQNGNPEVASIYQRKISFFPTPEASYVITLRGLSKLTALDMDADEPNLDDEFHQAIADLALHFEMVYENNPQAGVLITRENGDLSAQGGQAAVAVAMFRMAKKNIRNHVEDSPRMISRGEMAKYNSYRRLTKS